MKIGNNKNAIIAILIAVIILMAVGYAALAQTLNINGISNITSHWEILFIDMNIVENKTGKNVSSSFDATTATFDVELSSPGDYVEYTLTVENRGTFDALLSSVIKTNLPSTGAIIYTLSGADEGDILFRKTTKEVKVRVLYNPNITTQPSENELNTSITITLNYVQNMYEGSPNVPVLPILSFSAETTPTSITITVNQTNPLLGSLANVVNIDNYQFSNDGGKTFSSVQRENTYTFANLEPSTEYIIKVRGLRGKTIVGDSELKTIKTKELKVPVNSTIIGTSLYEIMSTNEFHNNSLYTFVANSETYPVRVFSFEENEVWSTNQTFGEASDVGTISTNATRMVVVKVNGDLTINSGVTVTAFGNQFGGPRGMLLYVTGTLTNNGIISMTARGAKSPGQNVFLYRNQDGTNEFVPAIGATGGAIFTGANIDGHGPDGSRASGRQTAGGGSGGRHCPNATCTSGGGATGTSYSGGSGGGGLSRRDSAGSAGSGIANGGAGGFGSSFQSPSFGKAGAGGAGNPGGANSAASGNAACTASPGANGTGGLLIIFANRLINDVSGRISSEGSNGGNAISNAQNSACWGAGGGGSGGGSINLFYKALLTEGTISVIGGVGGSSNLRGGAGGNGTVTWTQIPR